MKLNPNSISPLKFFLGSVFCFSLPFSITVAIAFYAAFELAFLILRGLSLGRIYRGPLTRDSKTNALYREYFVFKYSIAVKKPLLVFTPFCPAWFQPNPKTLLY